MSSDNTKATRIRILLTGHRLNIRPVPSCLDRLRTQRLRGAPDCNGSAVQSESESLLFSARPFTNGGLLEVICGLLQEAGTDFEIVDEEPVIPPLDLPSTGYAHLRAPSDAALLRLVCLRHRALVRYGHGCKSARFIEQVARAYPDATLIIATSRAAERDRIAAQLRKRGIELAKAYTARPPARNNRIVVSTWYGLAHSEIETWQRTFLFVPNALDSLHTRAQDALLQSGARFRLFGFLPMGRMLAPRERDLLACVFGLDDLVIPEHGRLARPVGVIWRPFRHPPLANASKSALDRKQVHFWNNPARNRLIRRAAQLFFAPQPRDVQQPEIPRIDSENSAARPVTLLTESVEHAVELAALLPQLPIIVEQNCELSGLSPRQRRIFEEGARLDNRIRHAIATINGLTAERLGVTEILIWAGAGKCPPMLPPGGLLDTLEHRRPLLVVDINDTGTNRIRRTTVARQNAYEDRLWFNPRESDTVRRIERFLAQRPAEVLNDL